MYRKFAVIEKFEKPADKAYWVCELGEFSKFIFEKVADHAAKVSELANAAKVVAEKVNTNDKMNMEPAM
jgi:hypothetical protein